MGGGRREADGGRRAGAASGWWGCGRRGRRRGDYQGQDAPATPLQEVIHRVRPPRGRAVAGGGMF